MSVTDELIVEEKGAICTLRFNRPEKRNLLTPDMLLEIESTLKRLGDERKVRCVVITGTGSKAFSSGYDISAIGKDDMIRNHEGDNPLPFAVKAIEEFPYPVIAMINGHVFGAGLEIAVTSDIRVIAEGSLLGMPPAKLGVVYSYRGVKKFMNLIGPGYTKELFLVGKAISAERAAQIGLVNFSVLAEELEKFTYALAEEVSENAPLSLKAIKEMASVWERKQSVNPEDEKLIRKMILDVQNSSDYIEGQKSFAEKRKPVFKGE
jgi:enoyl-CoA hydratase/carnithine racemase